jgi:hypothetical protein
MSGAGSANWGGPQKQPWKDWNRGTYQRRHHEKVMNSNSSCESTRVTIVKPATFRFLDSKKPSDILGRRMSNFLQGYAFYTRNGFSD